MIGGNRTLASTAVGAAPFVEEGLRWLPDQSQDAPEDVILPSDDLIPVPCPPLSNGRAPFEKRPSILVADDNADMRHYLVRLLAERYQVQAVPDGQAALAAVRESCPDLVLTDVMMPALDGFGLLHELRSDPNTRTVPVILLSARAGEESRIEGMEHGADDYLIKPFSARELLARVQTHLQMARLRKEAEEALRRRTEQFETLLNEAPLGAYLVDSDFRIRELNPTAHAVFGNVPNLIGMDFEELMRIRWPKEYADEILRRFRHTLRTGEQYSVPEWIRERRDNAVREFFEWQINRIPLPEGGYGVVCYFRDISRQVHAREAIAKSEQMLRLATEAAELGIWHWYPGEDRVLWENERPYEIFGRTHEDGPITAAEFREKVCHPDDLPAFQQAFERTMDTGVRFFFQGRIFRKDGACVWVEFTAQVERGADGSPLRLLGTIQDITERKHAEEALRQSEERLRLAQKVGRSGTWESNIASGQVITSPELQELFGFDAATASGDAKQWRKMVHPEDLTNLDKALAHAIANKSECRAEFRITRADGVERWIETTAQMFYDDRGKPLRIIGVSTDITERKHIEDRERQMAAEAVAATAKFRAVFEQTPVFAGIMALDGTIIDANQLCLEACGYRAEDVLGHLFWETGWWRRSKEVQAKIRAATTQAARGTPLPGHLHHPATTPRSGWRASSSSSSTLN